MEEKKKTVHSLTAYKCRICFKYRTENLLKSSEHNQSSIDLVTLLIEYFDYIKRGKIDIHSNRMILLRQPPEESNIAGNAKKIVLRPDAGKANENFTVLEYATGGITSFDGKENSAIYEHNVFCYLSGEKNIFVFHRHGQSGCKMVFQNTFNSFLESKGLVCHFDALVSSEMFENRGKYSMEKLSLVTTYSDSSSDIADNLRRKRKKVEQEVIIALTAPRARNIVEYLRSIFEKQPTMEELKSILIRDFNIDQFDDAKLTVKFGRVRRKISLSEFSGLIAEYDITNKLEFWPDGSVKLQSLSAIADQYALSFLEGKE